MAGVSISIDDSRIRAALQRLVNLGGNQKEMMKAIATAGESGTRERFDTQTGPDGKPWKPSIRAQISDGKTLTLKGHLRDSIVSDSGDDYAQWCTNKIYAAIHQFGGVIRAKTARGLFFKLANGSGRRVKQVTMPARPYLGITQ